MRGFRNVVAAAVAVVVLVAAANSASAAVTTHTSALGAGYQSAPVGGVTSATATFVVPSITCAHNNDLEPLYVGVFGLNSSHVLHVWANLLAACNNGVKTYSGSVVTGVQNQSLSVAIGDTVQTKLVENGTKTTVTFRNLSHQTSVSISTMAPKDVSVLVGDYGHPIVPTFTSVRVSAAKVNGVAIADVSPVTRERLRWYTAVQIAPTAVVSGQAGFNLVFNRNS